MSSSIIEGDIKFFLNPPEWADIKLTNDGDLVLDDGLENMVLISLFTDTRAEDNEVLPKETPDRKGWWGDALLDSNIGSRLWLLQREKIGNRLFTLAKQYCEDALAWMKEDGIIDAVEINISRDPSNINRIKINGVMLKVDSGQLGFEYFYNWRNQTIGKEVK